LLELFFSDVAFNPAIEVLLAVLSEHFKPDGHPDTGLVERLYHVELGEVMILIGVMLADQNDPVLFEVGNRLGHEHFLIRLQIIDAVG
jgi:hypothetical protein